MGDTGAALALAPVVARAGAAQESVDNREAALASLGNAGLPQYSQTLFAATRENEPRLRARALRALRKLPLDTTAHRLLMGAIVDRDERVSRTAVQTLVDHGLVKDDIVTIREVVSRQEMQEGTYPALLSALSPYRVDHPEVDDTLRAILEQPLKHSAIKGRIRVMLSRGAAE